MMTICDSGANELIMLAGVNLGLLHTALYTIVWA